MPRLSRSGGRLDVDDDVGQLGEARHQEILDHVGCRMRGVQGGLAVEPQVQVEEDVVG